jgi:hypothetical protein
VIATARSSKARIRRIFDTAGQFGAPFAYVRLIRIVIGRINQK